MLTLLSIVISVAAVVAVTVGRTTTQEACETMYENVAGRAALEIAAARRQVLRREEGLGGS